jgi:hypothetical protein|tara:strand:+ start:1129 stop:1374 length:246 start_codon:yes stop_codon:yes gene_type:complete
MENINQKDIDEINIKILKQIKKQLTKNLSLSQLNTIARLALAFQKIIKNEIVGEGTKEKDELLYEDFMLMFDNVAELKEKT